MNRSHFHRIVREAAKLKNRLQSDANLRTVTAGKEEEYRGLRKNRAYSC